VANTKQAKRTGQKAKPASQTGGSTKKPVKKERGPLLSFLLVLVLLHGIFATFLAFSTLKEAYSNSRPLILLVLTLLSLADILAAVGMWNWKKWAITLYAVTAVVAAAIHIMLTGSTIVVFYDLLPVAILGYVLNLQSKRNLFE
jgi:hypothetical protein